LAFGGVVAAYLFASSIAFNRDEIAYPVLSMGTRPPVDAKRSGVKVYCKKGLATCGGIHYGHSVFDRQKYPPERIMPPPLPDNPFIAAY
jgi:hypothetical protein